MVEIDMIMVECRRIESKPRLVEEEPGVRMRFVKTYCFAKVMLTRSQGGVSSPDSSPEDALQAHRCSPEKD
jgi:hypothetical protein